MKFLAKALFIQLEIQLFIPYLPNVLNITCKICTFLTNNIVQ